MMMRVLWVLSWILYLYLLFPWKEGKLYKAIGFVPIAASILIPELYGVLLVVVVCGLYLLWYVDSLWKLKGIYLLSIGLTLIIPEPYNYYLWMFGFFVYYVHHQLKNPYIWIGYGALCIALYFSNYGEYLLWLMSCFVFYILEKYETTYRRRTEKFEENIWYQHYDEMKDIYKDMRGFRHDFHNHVQVLKGYLYYQKVDEATTYLQTLDKDYIEFDKHVQSGNLLVDAILNSKLQIMKQEHIQVEVKCELPEVLSIRDTDICVLVGNALDNAIESCKKLDEEKRSIRIYFSIFQNQLYLSVMNASEEVFEEKNKFISSKRGDHGYGLKRMESCVNKYNGYFNINQESGVFSLEIMLPITTHA